MTYYQMLEILFLETIDHARLVSRIGNYTTHRNTLFALPPTSDAKGNLFFMVSVQQQPHREKKKLSISLQVTNL